MSLKALKRGYLASIYFEPKDATSTQGIADAIMQSYVTSIELDCDVRLTIGDTRLTINKYSDVSKMVKQLTCDTVPESDTVRKNNTALKSKCYMGHCTECDSRKEVVKIDGIPICEDCYLTAASHPDKEPEQEYPT